MVEARERGMSTAEAIRIGTATTGRIITAAAAVLAVVAGSFVFSDLVMMKYLAFGLMAALLLDATVVRMFLVPSVMKLLGDDCWWAPRWMKRVQTRLGLGEIHLPDERKQPIVRTRSGGAAAAPRSVPATTSRPPHDPTHPATSAPSRARVTSRPEVRPPAQDESSQASTTRTPVADKGESEPATTQFTAPRNPAGDAPPADQRSNTPPPSQPAEREIESWLSDLRAAPSQGAGAADTGRPQVARPEPSAEETRAMPAANNHPGSHQRAEDGDTTALPTPPHDDDAATATEKLNTAAGDGAEKPRQRRGGGLSAQDLLRREGRF
jgi:RND superfamily putative drug exporter